MSVLLTKVFLPLYFVLIILLLGSNSQAFADTDKLASQQKFQSNSVKINRGRDIWFNATFGGEKFFAFLANNPNPQARLDVGLKNVVETPRSKRFQLWGTVNDPNCKANPNGGKDMCEDPHATGVIGIRQFAGPNGSTLFGITCASCHAGFHPLYPPTDVNEPKSRNIHPSIGNQYLKIGKIFAANLAADDPRRLMFDSWPDGTVDTTLLFDDHIMAPGVITAFWEQRHRPKFKVNTGRRIRNGQGGEDDVGGKLGAIRVYTNIGMCYAKCVAPRTNRPDPTAPIDVERCRRDCIDFPTDDELDDLVAFMRSIKAPLLPESPRQMQRYQDGRRVFEQKCSSCHVTKGPGRRLLSNDEINPLILDPFNSTNACRALTTNWEDGHIWAPFSSRRYKNRAVSELKGYRTMPLTGVWATAPFLHNQSIGASAAPTASPQERLKAYETAMRELLTFPREPKINRLPVDVGQFPAGTPLAYLFNRDPESNELLCEDVVENRGHYFGSDLTESQKSNLTYWLRFQ